MFEPAKGLRVYGSYAEGYTVPDVGRILRAINVANVDVDTYLAIEPIVSAGGTQLRLDPDRWTVRTADDSVTAHFEHTVAIIEDGPLVLTATGCLF